MSGTEALGGYRRWSFDHDGKERDVYECGNGPGVLIISEIPGITPRVAAFGQRVAEAGFSAVLPHLFGRPGAPPTIPYTFQTMAWACISREFSTLALRRTSPVTNWLRALARSVHRRHGGPGVGVVGMCLTGGFALAMMVDEVVLAPVLSQPSLPFGAGPARRRDVGLSDADLARVRTRCEQEEGLCVLGLRFTGDRLVPRERFERLREELGDRFVAVEIDSSPGNQHGIPKLAHSVLTEHFVDEPGNPTRDALDRVLELFRDRLGR